VDGFFKQKNSQHTSLSLLITFATGSGSDREIGGDFNPSTKDPINPNE